MLCRRTASSLVVQAPAKLNLFLRVVGKRVDGYHDIETVMTTVDLYDTLIFRPLDGELRLTVRMAGCLGKIRGVTEAIPEGAENLVLRAARLLREETGYCQGAEITLIKRIPSAAGLGGGSSDAAAALSGLNQFWGLGASQETLCRLAAQLGSDIPFFLGTTPAAACFGRGEILEPLASRAGLTYVVAKPASGLSTPAVYRNCRPEPAGTGLSGIRRALFQGRADLVAQYLRNDLQAPAFGLNPEVRHLSCLFAQQSVRGHQLSGSGSACFAVCDSRSQAAAVAARLRGQGVAWVAVVQGRC